MPTPSYNFTISVDEQTGRNILAIALREGKPAGRVVREAVKERFGSMEPTREPAYGHTTTAMRPFEVK